MCGRYLFVTPPEETARIFNVEIRHNFPARYNIAPTQPVGVIRRNEARAREFALVRWGFIPSWARKPEGRPLINARGETVADKPSFRSAYKRRRCLFPADGFYEWKSMREGAKQPFCIKPAIESLFAFAGIWETAIDPDGGEIDTAAILTIDAGEDLNSLHAREPVVISPENYDRWIETEEQYLDEIADLIAPRPSGFWKYYAVSKAVGNARNEGEYLASETGARDLFG